jgi:site-specific recombinase XerD
LDLWAEHYFRIEVTTGERSQKEQRRDLALFLRFMEQAAGTLARSTWTPRLSRAFVDGLRRELRTDGARHYSDRTINRVTAHLKTFAKWIHKLRPFPLGNPTEKLKGLALNGVLELERALTEQERRCLLDAADHLPVLGGRSRDRRRYGDLESADERPRRKGYRPWRNRAIIYTLIETGMRRAEVTSIDLQGIDPEHHTLLITEKGGQQRKCQVSREGLKAIKDYIREERGVDAEMFPQSPALFLPAETVTGSRGRLTPAIVNRLWNDLCASARVKGRTPHSARHAMGVHLVKKTGNPRTAQRQLGHRNPSTTMQYMQFTRKEMQEALDDR